MTLILYHGTRSVCSGKVRVALAEKGLAYESRVVDLYAGEQFSPWYLRLNPAGVVPTLVGDEGPITESSVIVQYVDDLSDESPLMPFDPYAAALARRYLLRCLDIHAATNSLTFAVAGRFRELKKSESEREAGYARMPSPAAAAKRRDLVDNGVNSAFVDGAVRSFAALFKDMDADLGKRGDWVLGRFSLADIALIAYVDRLDRLGLNRFWTVAHPAVDGWLERFKQRPSYAAGIEAFNEAAGAPDAYRREFGLEAWPVIGAKLATAASAGS